MLPPDLPPVPLPITGELDLHTFDPRDLDQLIRWQVKKSTPFPVDDACLTYTAGANYAGGREFIVVVSRRETIREYEGVCERIGIEDRMTHRANGIAMRLDIREQHFADKTQIRVRYTELVKRCHPDANGGDRSAETRLQRVIKAYKTLKKAKLA